MIATATDALGGVTPASAALKLTIKTSAPAPSGLGFAVAADKGTAGDTFTVAGKGEAGDTVTLSDGAAAVGTAVVAAGGTWSITTASPLAVGAHSLSAHEVNVAANTSPSSPAQSLTVKNATPNAVIFVGTAGTDTFTGGAGNDIFEFSAATLANADTVKGGGGSDELLMTTAGTVLAGGVGGVGSYRARQWRGRRPDPGERQFHRGRRGFDHGLWGQCRQHRRRLGLDRGQPGGRGRHRRDRHFHRRRRQRHQRWPGESGQRDKWIFCLTAARIAADQERP